MKSTACNIRTSVWGSGHWGGDEVTRGMDWERTLKHWWPNSDIHSRNGVGTSFLTFFFNNLENHYVELKLTHTHTQIKCEKKFSSYVYIHRQYMV